MIITVHFVYISRHLWGKKKMYGFLSYSGFVLGGGGYVHTRTTRQFVIRQEASGWMQTLGRRGLGDGRRCCLCSVTFHQDHRHHFTPSANIGHIQQIFCHSPWFSIKYLDNVTASG